MTDQDKYICKPIQSLEALDLWIPLVSTVPLQNTADKCFVYKNAAVKFSQLSRSKLPKMLVCHDMMGGYLDDKCINGSNNPDTYNITQWNSIDIFVYFSHHFITVPPPCWVDAAHLHGVPVLGTFITEWDNGVAICDKLFSSKKSVDSIVAKLVAVTRLNNFDGWLINIENPIQPDHVENIVYFLSRLRSELRTSNRESYVIWYDSVTKDGKLKWQNELNEANRMFFAASDGIFLNYCWNEENLKASVEAAEERISEVFVGVDVFGRGCFGGGGFNTHSALAEIHKHGLSTALFAPGWVYEHYGPKAFHLYNTHFWLKLMPWLNYKGPSRLPVRTSFCAGYGQAKFFHGKNVGEEPWCNLSRQNLQPLLFNSVGTDVPQIHLPGSDWENALIDAFNCDSNFQLGRISRSLEDAYHGGSCLRLRSQGNALFPILVCDVRMTDSLLVTVAFRDSTPDSSTAFSLGIGSKKLLLPLNTEIPAEESAGKYKVEIIPREDCELYRFVYGSDWDCSSDWSSRAFLIERIQDSEPTDNISSVSVISSNAVDIKLGFLGIYPYNRR